MDAKVIQFPGSIFRGPTKERSRDMDEAEAEGYCRLRGNDCDCGRIRSCRRRMDPDRVKEVFDTLRRRKATVDGLLDAALTPPSKD